MKLYLDSIFHQLEVANSTILKLIDLLTDNLIDEEIFEDKRTIRELMIHIAMIYKADYMIMNEATKEEMDHFYAKNSPDNLVDVKTQLLSNFQFLKENILALTQNEMEMLTTSWWGVSYSRFEWLVEIVAHVYHHRAQLHSLLLAKGIAPKIALFE